MYRRMNDKGKAKMDPSPEEFARIHQFAETALEEIKRRAESDGIDLTILHSAFVVAASGYLVNHFGRDRARDFLKQIASNIDQSATFNPS